MFKKTILPILILCIIIALSYFIYHYTVEKKVSVHETEETQAVDTVKYYKYGFPIEDFNQITGVVKYGETLSSILNTHDISFGVIDKIAKKAKQVFNVKRIKAGKNYLILGTKDSISNPEYFIYENSAREYIVFDLRDTLQVYKGENEVETKLLYLATEIESSLWYSIINKGGNPLLAIALSEVFQWTIDFFGIQKKDFFKVIYTEDFIEGKSIGNIKPFIAMINHMGTTFYGFYYNDTIVKNMLSYYDENGNSLQKSFLKAPLKYSRVSSRFSHSRFHPVLRRYRPHHGVDYAAPTGTPVFTVANGRIIAKAYQRRGAGRYIKIRHSSTFMTVFPFLFFY